MPLNPLSRFGKEWSGQRQALAAIALEQTATYGGGRESLKNARSLSKEDTIAVVCGQQPAVGGGPLYSLVKCADAIARCQSMVQTGQSAVPVFWCASDDHDAGEADHADLIHRDGRIHRIRSPIERAGAAIHYQSAASHWPQLMAALADLEGPRLGKDWLRDYAPKTEEGLGAWFCRLLAALFAEQGLICLEAKDLRPLWHNAIGDSLTKWPREALASLREDLLQQGRDPAFPPLEYAPWFIDEPSGRRALGPEEVREVFQRDPNLLSPGAAIRPILQQLALPAAVYCAGLGELAYHAFLTPIYDALTAPKPALSERHHISLIDAWCSRGLEQWNRTISAFHPNSPLPKHALAASSQEAITVFERHIAELTSLSQSAEDGGDHDTAKRLTGAIRKLHRQREQLAQSLERGARQRSQRTPAGALRNWLYPRDQPQERIMSSLQAIWHYGPGLGKALVDAAKNGIEELRIDAETPKFRT